MTLGDGGNCVGCFSAQMCSARGVAHVLGKRRPRVANSRAPCILVRNVLGTWSSICARLMLARVANSLAPHSCSAPSAFLLGWSSGINRTPGRRCSWSAFLLKLTHVTATNGEGPTHDIIFPRFTATVLRESREGGLVDKE